MMSRRLRLRARRHTAASPTRRDSAVLVAVIGAVALLASPFAVKLADTLFDDDAGADDRNTCAVIAQQWKDLAAGDPDQLDILADAIEADQRTRECGLDPQRLKDLVSS